MPPPTATTTSASREAGAGEATGQLLHGGEGLGFLAVGDDADLGGDAGVEAVDPSGLPDRLLRHDHRGLGARRHEAGRLMARPRPDQDRVRTLGQVDGKRTHLVGTPRFGLGRGGAGAGVAGGVAAGVAAGVAGSLRVGVGGDQLDDTGGDRLGRQVVDVDHEVGQLGVERRPHLVETDHCFLRVLAEERAPGAVADAGGEGLGPRPEPDDGAAVADEAAVVGVQHGAARHRHDRRRSVGAGTGERLGFCLAEGRLPVAGEELGHGEARRRFHVGIGVPVAPAEAVGHQLSGRRLAGAHHPDEQNARGHPRLPDPARPTASCRASR